MSLHIWLEPVPDEKEFVRQWQAQTDKEGYFRQEMPASKPYATGWRNIYANVRDKESQGRALIVPEGNRIGIISDIDDTVMISEVHSKRRLLSNTFLKNTLQRQTFPGTAGLYAMLAQKNPEPAATPIFYLSASPRQLHGAITKFLEHNQFPAGILVAKRISYDLAGEPIFDQHAYKTEKIKEIFGRLPNVCFILAGDDGEKDPEIYNHIRQTYSDRVLAVWIRRVNPDPERPRYNGQQDFPSSLETTGLPQ